MLPCPFHLLTGFDCPFCGAQRGIWALLHGDVVGWWHYNPMLWMLMPYFCILFLAQLYRPSRQWRWVAWCCSNRVMAGVAGALILWGVVRNLL